MAARIIDGSAQAQRVRREVAEGVRGFVAAHGRAPGLATVLVGDDPGSGVYVAGKQRDCREVGMFPVDHRLPGDTGQEAVVRLLAELNADPRIDGILLQLPVPAGMDGAGLTARIDPAKDVDGLTPVSAGRLAQGLSGLRPCTPAGVIELLDVAGVELRGARAVVIGRSNLVGKPLAALLLARDATVTQAHSHTRDLAALAASAGVLVAATGRPRMVGADWVRPGAAVVDVGITRADDGLTGDVDFDAAVEVAGWITPVPGGVGPMTRAGLLRNTLAAAQAREGD